MSVHGNVVGRTVCPSCTNAGADRAGDNLVVYEDDYKKCFACGHYEMPSGTRKQKGNVMMTDKQAKKYLL